MKTILLISTICFSISLNAQVSSEDSVKIEDEYQEIIEWCLFEPEYYGGEEALLKYLKAEINAIQEKGVFDKEGIVYVDFWISKSGEVVKEKIARGLSEEIDAEVLAIFKRMPDWFPGTKSGFPISKRYMLPIKINFR